MAVPALATAPEPAGFASDSARLSCSAGESSAVLPLTAIDARCCKCVAVEGNAHAQIRLKRMGICPGRIITVVQTGDPMVLRVVGVQLGVSRLLASCVLVKQSDDTVSGVD